MASHERNTIMPVKSIPSIHSLGALLIAASLAACANPRSAQDRGQQHPAQAAPTTVPNPTGTSAQSSMLGGPMKEGHAGCGMMGAGREARPGGMPHMDKESMCAMYRSMRDAPTEQERQAMMERNMPGMPPGMREQHMEMMRQQCQ
jgi:hypothetical protein